MKISYVEKIQIIKLNIKFFIFVCLDQMDKQRLSKVWARSLNMFTYHMVNVVQLVERQFVALVGVDSSPATPAIFDLLTQLVEYLTLNQGVLG